MKNKNQEGSIELVVLALLAALIVTLAIPLLTNIGTNTQEALSYVNGRLDSAVATAMATPG